MDTLSVREGIIYCHEPTQQMHNTQASHHASTLADIRMRSAPVLEAYYLIDFMILFHFQIQR